MTAPLILLLLCRLIDCEHSSEEPFQRPGCLSSLQLYRLQSCTTASWNPSWTRLPYMRSLLSNPWTRLLATLALTLIYLHDRCIGQVSCKRACKCMKIDLAVIRKQENTVSHTRLRYVLLRLGFLVSSESCCCHCCCQCSSRWTAPGYGRATTEAPLGWFILALDGSSVNSWKLLMQPAMLAGPTTIAAGYLCVR